MELWENNTERSHISFTQFLPVVTSCQTIAQLGFDSGNSHYAEQLCHLNLPHVACL